MCVVERRVRQAINFLALVYAVVAVKASISLPTGRSPKRRGFAASALVYAILRHFAVSEEAPGGDVGGGTERKSRI